MTLRKWAGPARVGFLIAGLAFTAAAMVRGWGNASLALPRPGALVGSMLLLCFSVWLAPRTLAPLLASARPGPKFLRAYYESLLGKYIPGGVWQGVGQIGLVAHAGFPLDRAAVAFFVHMVAQVAAAAAVGALLAVAAPDLPILVRVAAAGGIVLSMLLWRPGLLAAIRFVSRIVPALTPRSGVPMQSELARCLLGCVVLTLSAGGAFALLLAEFAPGAGVVRATTGFAFAWMVGALALPFPSGIGIREAVLAVVLPGATAGVMAASLAFRVLILTVEGAFVTVVVLRGRAASGSGMPR